MYKKILLGVVVLSLSICTLHNFAQAASIPPRQTANKVNTTFPHWRKSPISVYIPKDDNAAAMQRAFLRWQRESSGKAAFKFVEDEKNADVNVTFAEKVDGSDGPIGAYNLTISGMEIQKAEIILATKSPNIKKYSRNYIFTVMLHEIGHILGMSDNQRKPSSIMYMPVSEEQDIMKIDIRKLYTINGWSYNNRNFNN